MAEETKKTYNYKGNDLDQDLLIRNLNHNIEGYVKSRGWDESKQQEFYDAYNKYLDAIQNGRMSSDISGSLLDSAGELDNGSANYRDANGNVISSDAYNKLKKRKKRNITQDFYPNRAVASYVNLIAGGLYDKLNGTQKEEEEPQAFDLGTQGLWTGYLNSLNPLGEVNYSKYWEKDPYVEGTGRPTTNRAKHLSQYITNYLADLDKNYSNYDFSETPFRSLENYKQRLNELQSDLSNGWQESDYNLLQSLGVRDTSILDKLFTTDEVYKAPDQATPVDIGNPGNIEESEGNPEDFSDDLETAWNNLTPEEQQALREASKKSWNDWNDAINQKDPRYKSYKESSIQIPYNEGSTFEDTRKSFMENLHNALNLPDNTDIETVFPTISPTELGPYMNSFYNFAKSFPDEFNNIFYTVDKNTAGYEPAQQNQAYMLYSSYNPKDQTALIYYPHNNRTVRVHIRGLDRAVYNTYVKNMIDGHNATNTGNNNNTSRRSYLQEGGYVNLSKGEEVTNWLREAAQVNAERKANPKNAVIGKGDAAHAEWSTAEKMRLASIAADVVALADPEAFSSLALGLGSDIANLSADIKSGYGLWNTLGNATVNFGMTALSAIPAAGQVVSGGKALKTLVKLAPKLIKYASWAATAGIVANGDEILQSLKKVTKSGVEGRMTVEDWRNIAMIVQLALGRTKAHLGKKEVNKKYNIATGKEPSQGGPAFTKGKRLLLEDNNGNLVEQNFTHPSVVEAIQNAKTPAELNALLASLPEYKNFHVPTESTTRTLRFSNNPNYKWYKPWTYKTKEASTVFRNGAVSDMMDMTNLRRAYQQGQFDNWFGRITLGQGKGHMQPYFLRNARTPAADSRDLETLRGNGLIPKSRRLEDFRSRVRAASGPLGPVVRNTTTSITSSTTPPTSTTGTKSKGTSFNTSAKPKVPKTSGNPSRPLAVMDEDLLLSKAEEYLKTEIEKGTFNPATTEHSESWWELLARNPKITANDLIELGIWKQGGVLSYITKTPKFKLGGNFNKEEQSNTSVSPNVRRVRKGKGGLVSGYWDTEGYHLPGQPETQEEEINPLTVPTTPVVSEKNYGTDYNGLGDDYYAKGVYGQEIVSAPDVQKASDAKRGTGLKGPNNISKASDYINFNNLNEGERHVMEAYSTNNNNRIHDFGNFTLNWLQNPDNKSKSQSDMLADYNKLIDSFYEFQHKMAGLDKKYITNDEVGIFNRNHKLVYDLANTPDAGYYGYEEGQENTYGTATAHRGVDRTDKDIDVDFSDYGNGVLSPELKARFDELTKNLTKDTTGRYYARPEVEETPAEAEQGKTKVTQLEQPQTAAAKTSKWSTLSGALTDMLPNSLAVGRYLAARQLNKRLLHKMPILLNDPEEALRWTRGNQNAVQAGYQEQGELTHYASQPTTANGAEQTAAMLEALARGNYYVNHGYELNDQAVKTSTEANWNQARANQQSRHETAAGNRSNLFQGRTDWLTRRDAKWRADQASLDALLGQFETQFRDRNAENKTYREAVQKASIYNTVVADLADNNVNATPEEQALLNDLLSGTRKYTQLSTEEKATYNRLSKEINEEVTRQMAGLKGLNYTALHLNGATSFTPEYLRSGGVFAGDSEKVVIQKLRNKVQKMQIRQKHLEAQLRAYEKDMDRARKSASEYIKGQKKSK